jgi:arylsulfatase A-like enzyme
MNRLSFAFLLAIFLTGACSGAARAQQQQPPNVLVFVADDAGGRAAGPYGNEAIRTPTIDRLAETGLKVERAFLTIAQCSPSRISILSGKYPHATGAEDLHMPTPDSLRLLPSYLSERAGYYTGAMGKRHLGSEGSEQFDWYDAAEDHDFGAFSEFVEEAEEREQPFFMWTGFYDPHRPYDTTSAPSHDPADVELTPYLRDTPATREDRARYYDEIARMDRNMDRMLQVLRRRGLRENTLVIYLSDNGAPFPQAKGTVFDAGIRTPLIFSWPARVAPGQVYDRGLVSVIDLAPTLLAVAGVEETPAQMQGRSMAALFDDSAVYEGRDYVFAERNWHDCDEHIRAVRSARYKLVRTGDYTALPMCTAADIAGSPSWFALRRGWEDGMLTEAQRRTFETPRPQIALYDLEADPWETENVAGEASYRAATHRLAETLSDWMADTNDFPPTVRWRPDATDRLTGVYFYDGIPPMRDPARNARGDE